MRGDGAAYDEDGIDGPFERAMNKPVKPIKKRKTADQLALRIMLADVSAADKAKDLKALNEKAKEILENRDECPECGSKDEKEDNGLARGRINFSLLCTKCGTQFEPRDDS